MRAAARRVPAGRLWTAGGDEVGVLTEPILFELVIVSVIIPTMRRPRLLAQAVRAVLAQEVPEATELEVIIGVSDPRVQDDVDAAHRVAAEDQRVKVALGPARGASGTRNAAIKQARGSILAFIDDDCEPQPGWLTAGLAAMAEADIVQGATHPAAPVPRFHHSVTVVPPSWLWETCNLMVRRDFIERAGGFNEMWNAAGREGNLFQFGEDAEIGWRIIRAGGRPAFADDARVTHAVFPRRYREYLAYKAGIRRFPRLFRTTPEVRRIFYRDYFVNRRHPALAGGAAAALVGAAAVATGHHRAGGVLLAGALIGQLWDIRRNARSRGLEGAVAYLVEDKVADVVELVCATYGSIRWRRLLI